MKDNVVVTCSRCGKWAVLTRRKAHCHEPPDYGYWKIARSQAATMDNASSQWRASLMVDFKSSDFPLNCATIYPPLLSEKPGSAKPFSGFRISIKILHSFTAHHVKIRSKKWLSGFGFTPNGPGSETLLNGHLKHESMTKAAFLGEVLLLT